MVLIFVIQTFLCVIVILLNFLTESQFYFGFNNFAQFEQILQLAGVLPSRQQNVLDMLCM